MGCAVRVWQFLIVCCSLYQVAPVRAAADSLAKLIVKQLNIHAVSTVLPTILAAMEPKCVWQTKVLAAELVGILSERAPKQIAIALPDVVPAVGHTVSDAKVQVKVCRPSVIAQTRRRLCVT
jgi:hypothetical protein